MDPMMLNPVNKVFSRLAVLILVMVCSIPLMAQDGYDTSLVKSLGISRIRVYVKIPILPNRTKNDSCLAEEYRFDSLGRLVYMENARRCYGWGGSSQTDYYYSNGHQPVKTREVVEEGEIFTNYFYNTNGDVVKMVKTSPQKPDSSVTVNIYKYNASMKPVLLISTYQAGEDTGRNVEKFVYDDAMNLKEHYIYSGHMTLLQKETYDITPKSRKLLEFSKEVFYGNHSFTRAWNYYNLDAQLYRTQYSNNTWTDFEYTEYDLITGSMSYNMQGKLNLVKTYVYEFRAH